MNTRKTTAVTAVLLTSAAITFLSAGSASATGVRVAADLNGDGTAEQVTIENAGTADQRIVTDVDGHEVSANAPADTRSQVARPRVTDLNGDGAAELVVLEYTGANTDTFGVWTYVDSQLRPVGTENGEALRLYEGGGVSARSGYTCETVGGTRELAVLGAQLDEHADDPTYTGGWTYYRLDGNIVTPTGTSTAFTSVSADNPLMNPDAAACDA